MEDVAEILEHVLHEALTQQLLHWAFIAIGIAALLFVVGGLVRLARQFRFRGVLAAGFVAAVAVVFAMALLERPKAPDNRAEDVSVDDSRGATQPEPRQPLPDVTAVPSAPVARPNTAGLDGGQGEASGTETLHGDQVPSPPVAPGLAVAKPGPAQPLPSPAERQEKTIAEAERGRIVEAPEVSQPGRQELPAERRIGLLLASNRKPESASDRMILGFTPGDRLLLGRAVISAAPASTRTSAAAVGDVERLDDDEWRRLTREALERSEAGGHAVIVVHGYRTSFDAAVSGAARLAVTLDGVSSVFLFSWPSGGPVASYSLESNSARRSAAHLRQLVELVVHSGGARKLSLVAEGLGGQALFGALEQLRSSAASGAELAEVALVAPDMDAAELARQLESIKGMARHVTLYASASDPALEVARRYHAGVARAGSVADGAPLVLAGVETVDMSTAGTQCFAAPARGGALDPGCAAVAADIASLIADDTRPPDRRMPGIERRTTADGASYWRYP